jgi:hypothetical protein
LEEAKVREVKMGEYTTVQRGKYAVRPIVLWFSATFIPASSWHIADGMFSRITESFPTATQDPFNKIYINLHKNAHTAASIAERDRTIAALRKGLTDMEQEQHQRIATLVQQLEVCILTRVPFDMAHTLKLTTE